MGNPVVHFEVIGKEMGPEEMTSAGIIIGMFSDPEGHVIGVMSSL